MDGQTLSAPMRAGTAGAGEGASAAASSEDSPVPASRHQALGERLAARVAERESQLVVGIDPDPAALWPASETDAGAHPAAGDADTQRPAARTAAAVTAHCRALIDAVAPASVGVKFQLACFERLQAAGWAALGELIEYAHDQGLLVIADGKRGDVPVSAAAYAQGLFAGLRTPSGEVPGLGADLATVNPLMGKDALAPFVETARKSGAGILALVRTSNPGAQDVEDALLADGRTVWERLAELVSEIGADGVSASGLSDVGAVMGATAPAHLSRARELMPHAIFLLPGVGAQGGRVEVLAAAFADLGEGGRRASVLITAARSVVAAFEASGSSPAHAARAEAERLRATAWALQ